MALPDIFPNMAALAHDPPQISLVKIVALLREQIIGSTSGSSPVSSGGSTALEASNVIKAVTGTVYTVRGYNTSGGALFLQLFDAAALPVDTTVPLAVVPIAANSAASFDFGALGLPFTNGLVVALSSTDDTLTISGANGLFLATYR